MQTVVGLEGILIDCPRARESRRTSRECAHSGPDATPHPSVPGSVAADQRRRPVRTPVRPPPSVVREASLGCVVASIIYPARSDPSGGEALHSRRTRSAPGIVLKRVVARVHSGKALEQPAVVLTAALWSTVSRLSPEPAHRAGVADWH
jgi:hypothetical protein